MMKKVFMGIIGVSILLAATFAFARPWEQRQNGQAVSAEQKQFFDATRELRKEMHDKRFLLMEYYRTGEDAAKIDELEREINALQARIQEKATELGISNGQSTCNQGDSNCGRGQGYSCGLSCNNACGNQQASMGCGKTGRCGQP